MKKKTPGKASSGKRASGAGAAARPRRLDGLEASPMDDGFMVHQPGSDRVHYFNHTGLLVFELCDGRHTAAEIADLVGSAYRLPQPPLAAVREILARMADEGLLVSAEG